MFLKTYDDSLTTYRDFSELDFNLKTDLSLADGNPL